jgi:hypothetical protein
MRAFDTALLWILRAVSWLQVRLGVEPEGVPLSELERQAAGGIFGKSVDLSLVRLKVGNSGLLTSTKRPWTLGNTIYFPEGWGVIRPTLLHELTHVWQFQNGGPAYMRLSVIAQYFGEGYDLEPARGRAWPELNPEQQAEVIELGSMGQDPTGTYQQALEDVRAGKGAPN